MSVPTLVVPGTGSEPPRFDLPPTVEIRNYDGRDFVPRLPGMKVGDLVRIDDYVTVRRIVGEDDRWHEIEYDHSLSFEWVD